MHLAAGCGNAEMVEVLVKEGNAELDIYDARNQTPMHYAVKNKKLKVVRLLIDFGANVNYDERDL